MNSKLVVGKEYFETELKKRITIGEEIFNRSIQTTRQFEDGKRDYYDWNDYRFRILKNNHSTTQTMNIKNVMIM